LLDGFIFKFFEEEFLFDITEVLVEVIWDVVPEKLLQE